MSMANAYAPIGVFDSGVGGLSVVRRLRELLPNETLVYLADQAHVPYGGRDLSQVHDFACGISAALIGAGCKAIVMACNVSSAVALEAVQEAHPTVPIVGVITPGVEAALQAVEPPGNIGVLATEGTAKSGAYLRAILNIRPSADVVTVTCPRFVPLIEAGLENSEEARQAVREYLVQMLAENVDAVILGCTHYPFLLPLLQAEAPQLRFIDPAYQTAAALQERLGLSDLLCEMAPGVIRFLYTTGRDVNDFDKACERFLAKNEYRLTVAASWKKSALFLPDFPHLVQDALLMH